MRIGYLMNTYPVTSATFIRREIAALEAQGVQVARFAIRPWDQPLVDPADTAEAARTRYLLAPGGLRLLVMALAEGARAPRGMVRAVAAAWRLWRAAGPGSFVRHAAYLLEAAHLKRAAVGCTHLHAHFATNTAAVALLCARMGGPGYSFTAHGPDEFDDPAAGSLAAKLAGARFAVAISHFARTRLALAGGMGQWSKLHVVRCGVDTTALTPAPPPADDAPFVCVGRLCPQKAQTLLVEALAQVGGARLVLLGDGQTRAQIAALIAQHGLDGRVTLQGWADSTQVAAAIRDARALVLPSFAEGLPIVLMEALALGRPVITTHVAGIPELVDDACGWLVPAGDVDALAAALVAARDTPPVQLARMGAAGRARVLARHDVAENAAQLRARFAQAAG